MEIVWLAFFDGHTKFLLSNFEIGVKSFSKNFFCLHIEVLDTLMLDFFPFCLIGFFIRLGNFYFFCMACMP